MKSLTVGVVVTSLLFLLSSNSNVLIYGQEEKKQQNDFVFNVQGLLSSPTTKDFQITGPAWEKICPSNQCQIEEIEYGLTVIPNPQVDSLSVSKFLDFYVHDNITNKDLTPLQKKFAERYQLSFFCHVNSVKDIIEQANNTIYKCSGDSTDIRKSHPEETDPSYYFKVNGTYDTQSDTLNATGNYDRQYPP